METKSCELAIKKVSEGKVVATLARLGVRDRDGDVLKTGLLNGRQVVAIKPQHKWDHVNLGVAQVYETAGTLEAAMEFNMAIPSAKDWFEAIKFSHEKNHRQEYSFGFQVIDSEQAQHDDGKAARFLKQISMAEVSPVLIGASIGSQTISVKNTDAVKSTDALLSGHQEAIDGPTKESRGVEIDHPEGEIKAMGMKEHMTAAMTSMRSSREHMKSSRALMSNKAAMGMMEHTDAAMSDMDTAMEHCDSCMGMMDENGKSLDSEDYAHYSDEKRPPLPVFIKWGRGLVYHLKFVWDVRKREGKEISEETTEHFKEFVDECLEACALMRVKVLRERLMPTMEEEELARQRRDEKFKELTAHKTEQEELARLQVNAQMENLVRASREREAEMKRLHLK